MKIKRMLLLALAAGFVPACGEVYVPVPGSSDYPHGGYRETVFAPDTGQEFRLFEPQSPSLQTAPVVVFLHGWGGMNSSFYKPWLVHLTRRGNVVVWVRYQASLLTLSYEFLPNTIAAARAALRQLATDYPSRPAPDINRLAVVGHSMGGVLAMSLAARAADEGLPPFKAVMTVLPGQGIAGNEVLADSTKLPPDTLLLCVAGSDDPYTRPFAANFFYATPQIGLGNKDFVTLNSDRSGDPNLVADHFTPNCVADWDVNQLDRHGCWKLLDGLAASAFYGLYREYALGNTPEQRFMGTWPDGRPVVKASVTDAP